SAGRDRRRRHLPRLRPRRLRHRRRDPGGRRHHQKPALKTLRRISWGAVAGTTAAVGVVLLVATAAILWILPSNDYVFLPDKAQPVAPLVTVKGGHDPKGPSQIYYDAVIVRRARLFEQLFHFVHSGETLVPASEVNPPGASDQQTRVVDLHE